MPRYPKPDTQEDKVLQTLLNADGDWVNKQVFIRQLYLTQAGRAIWNLENKYGWKIIHSDFTDDHGFKSYKIAEQEPVTLSLIPTPTPS